MANRVVEYLRPTFSASPSLFLKEKSALSSLGNLPRKAVIICHNIMSIVYNILTMTVCLFGHYAPNYSRNRVIKKGLIANGVRIAECNQSGFIILRYLMLIIKYFQSCKNCDLILVGFPGNEDVPLAWILGKFFGKKVVFDAFISRYDTKVLDRKEHDKGSLLAKLDYLLDWQACFLADKVLLDTKSHIAFFAKTFSLPRSKFNRIFVGTDETVFFSRKREASNTIMVSFHGYYIPLQGTKYIIEAAHLLRHEKNLTFRLLGNGPDFRQCLKLAKKWKLQNIEFLEPVSYETLPEFISQADIYLGGPFGRSGKASRVIPNKVYEALATSKAVIVGDSGATRELLTSGKDCYMVERADARKLAQAIKTLVDNGNLREKIAEKGYELFRRRLTSRAIGRQLLKVLKM